MCRVFGFRSVLQSGVHSSLIDADNNLGSQSVNHPDGWGVAYYVAQSPHLVRSASQALNDSLFHKVSGVVSSETVLAHIRKSTLGEVNILNTHPFQYGRWVFAHNGNIKNFEIHKDALTDLLDPHLKRYILGETDSELIFYIILSALIKLSPIDRNTIETGLVLKAVKQSVKSINHIIGENHNANNGPPDENYLTFIISDGQTMLAHHGGKDLYYSTYKKRCPERGTCASFSGVCEKAVTSGPVNHMIFSSEPLSGENIWLPLEPGQIMGVDSNMNLIIE